MTTPLLKRLRALLASAGDPVRAEGARRYMKSEMPHHGVPTPLLRSTCKELFRSHPLPSAAAWRDEVLGLWRKAEFREERYAAIELAGDRRARSFEDLEALPMYEEMIVTGAWWDMVDSIASHRIGALLRKHPVEMKRTLLAWSRDENLWKRRTAILSQLGFKKETDLPFLYACIEPSLPSKEFFLRKGIGWALRQYAWTDPDEVKRYVAAKADTISALSRREALKNVERKASPRCRTSHPGRSG
jgi:3-methyladenine DNA glycosylase AlkD